MRIYMHSLAQGKSKMERKFCICEKSVCEKSVKSVDSASNFHYIIVW